MPAGAILSPPESGASSDEDETQVGRGRTIENLKELHDAISQIPQHRECSPGKAGAASHEIPGDLHLRTSQSDVVAEGIRRSFTTGSLDGFAAAAPRRISHLRSATESSVSIMKSAESLMSESEEDTEEDMMQKPQMVRKKSGELVRPALRPASRRRPSSMPGTPTFNKAVHFDSHLEHVRHFLQVDRPLAVSAGSSPVDNYDSDTEYPFHGEEKAIRSPPFEWEILMSNFPVETPIRKAAPVRLERVWLSNDQNCLVGSVVVNNLAYQKMVTCRFTLDYWKTTSEVAAEYVSEVRPSDIPAGQDRFNFTIKLSDLANLESKTLFFCVRYSVHGRELWDNNSGTNFQVDFHKKMNPVNGKKAKDSMGTKSDGLFMKPNRKTAPPVTKSNPAAVQSHKHTNEMASKVNKQAPSVSEAVSPVPGITSSSYEELVNKYCFFGSKQSSPSLKDGTIRSGRFDGFDDGAALRNNGNSSMTASPVPASRALSPTGRG
ncbi:hypothetical protein P8C59_000471 [Phyllachora maydis]|uniref:CBM21 domain-containing protein n=1 Tax=Phyllachora maydis TaxID=1825666 RepID=A0AAD9MAE0_9PEZI|nr:hypothetical protein P8C59_000471 [Phyllachora maydis]